MCSLCFIAAMGEPLDEKPPPKYGAHDILLNPRIDFERVTIVRPAQVTNHDLNVQCAQGRQVDMCACSPGQSSSPIH